MDSALANAVTGELRALVSALGTRRAFPTVCHVGHPGGQRVDLLHASEADQGLRCDLVERAVDGLVVVEGACVWLTRWGDLSPTDADLAWLAAARGGFGRHDLPLPAFVVLNRVGWVDLVSGERREWSRVRLPRPPV